jgi:integrase
MKRRARKGSGSIYERGRTFWIAFSVNGKRHAEFGGNTKDEARQKLDARLAAVRSHAFSDEADRLTLHDAIERYRASLELAGKRAGVENFYGHRERVEAALGSALVHDLTSARLDDYARQRLTEGAAAATINRETALVGSALRFLSRSIPEVRVPHVTTLRENVRKGFVDPQAFEKVASALAQPLQDFARFAYATGWRKSEIAGLTWARVELGDSPCVRLDASKNGERRTLPLRGDALEIVRRAQGRRVLGLPFVFHHHGRPIADFRKRWQRACVDAGLGRYIIDEKGNVTGYAGLIFHDLRRSAARNLRRAGVAETVCQAITGHKTASMFRRYSIVDETDMAEAFDKLQTSYNVKE